MMESAADFGTGLRAHLGLEQAALESSPRRRRPDVILAAEAVPDAHQGLDCGALEALASLEAELLERERAVAQREASLAGRAGALLAGRAGALRRGSRRRPLAQRRRARTPAAAEERGLTERWSAASSESRRPPAALERLRGGAVRWLAIALLNPFVLLVPPLVTLAIWKAMEYGIVERHDPPDDPDFY